MGENDQFSMDFCTMKVRCYNILSKITETYRLRTTPRIKNGNMRRTSYFSLLVNVTIPRDESVSATANTNSVI